MKKPTHMLVAVAIATLAGCAAGPSGYDYRGESRYRGDGYYRGGSDYRGDYRGDGYSDRGARYYGGAYHDHGQ